MSEGFCTLCSTEIESFEGLDACPKCGTPNPPCFSKNQVDVSINLHELRILCMWSENWGNNTEADQEIVYAIANRLRKQLREQGKDVPLTFADEVQELRDAGHNVELHGPGGDRP